MRKATQHAATDPETGLIDMDAILTGKTTASRMRVNKIKDQCRKHDIIILTSLWMQWGSGGLLSLRVFWE